VTSCSRCSGCSRSQASIHSLGAGRNSRRSTSAGEEQQLFAWKIAGVSESNPSISWTNGPAPNSAIIVRYTGTDQTTPIEVGTAIQVVNSSAPSFTGVTTGRADMLICPFMEGAQITLTPSNPQFGGVAATMEATAVANSNRTGIFDLQQGSPGASGNATMVWTGANTTQAMVLGLQTPVVARSGRSPVLVSQAVARGAVR
jgi:hypothetical protein